MTIILEELEKYGVITYKRIYGDWANSQTAKWREKVLEYSLTPIQQFRNTVGKNAIDSALIIDAMDILYAGKVDGVCIVSSDSDFTRLANRLRESGIMVIGMGEEKSPHSFRVACSTFINLQSIEEEINRQDIIAVQEARIAKEEVAVLDEKNSKISSKLVSRKIIEQDIVKMIKTNESKGKVTELGEIGSRLNDQYPKFNVKQYGYNGLAKFLEEMHSIKMVKINTRVTLRIREKCEKDDQVYAYIRQVLNQNQIKGIELGALGRNIHNRYEKFDVKDFGYTKLSHFIQSIEGIEIKEERGKKNKKQMVYLKR